MSLPIILSIDGNIGSGKSTLYDDLQCYYKDNNDICFVPEPVDDWKNIVDKNNVPILTNLYKDTNKYAFRFQMMAYISRLHLLRKKVNENKYRIIITERCVDTDKNVFAQMLFDDGLIEHDEFQIYLMWFNEFLDDIKLSGIIYVRADPTVCNERVKLRARDGENIPIEYLTKCHNYHEKWLNTFDEKMVIDANVNTSIDENVHIKKQWIKDIDVWISKHLHMNDTQNTVINENNPILYFDGACRGNPSTKLGLGCVILDVNDTELDTVSILDESGGTNNDAEYLSLIAGLELAIKLNIKSILVRGDSELIIKQVTGEYQVRATNLIPLHNKVKVLEEKFNKISYGHVKREFNKRADKLANMALDKKTD
jgi:deoxyadenosine/deoxycytidine kinase/ribonuclease HI|tara:strand:+ start:4615 stop:5721 length:1107 start_codon:yes stop_codon:yes gene_type:complete